MERITRVLKIETTNTYQASTTWDGPGEAPARRAVRLIDDHRAYWCHLCIITEASAGTEVDGASES